MEELWMWRWECEFHLYFSNPLFKVTLLKLLKLHVVKKLIMDSDMSSVFLFLFLSASSWGPSCQCERYVSAEELCDTSCLSKLPQLSAQFSPDGYLLLSLKERNSIVWARVREKQQDHLQNDNQLHFACTFFFLICSDQLVCI